MPRRASRGREAVGVLTVQQYRAPHRVSVRVAVPVSELSTPDDLQEYVVHAGAVIAMPFAPAAMASDTALTARLESSSTLMVRAS